MAYLDLDGVELQMALVLAVHMDTLASEGAQLPSLRLPPHRRPPVAVRALLCAAASLAVNRGGLTPADVACELEAFAARMRSGEAEATARALIDQAQGRGGPKS